MTTKVEHEGGGGMTINIIDVIHHKNAYSVQTFVVIDRMPEWVYKRNGTIFTANDDGFYDFMAGSANKGDAFGGRQFTIKLDDDTEFLCRGDVWSVGPDPDVGPTLSVGVCTMAELEKCYVFRSASISKAKLDAWLSENTPSNNYYKYDPREKLEYWEAHCLRYGRIKQVSPARARKLRKKGVTLFQMKPGVRGYSQLFERKKLAIASRPK